MKKLRIVFWCMTLAMAALTAAYTLENACETVSAPTIAVQTESAIVMFRTDRDALRAMEKAQLNDIIHSDGSPDDIRADAQRRLMNLIDRQETETMLEGLLMVRGFAGAIVSANGDCINVLIDAATVTARESTAIMDIICAQTDVQCGNVKIIPAG